jgi:hypothetical protein
MWSCFPIVGTRIIPAMWVKVAIAASRHSFPFEKSNVGKLEDFRTEVEPWDAFMHKIYLSFMHFSA